MAYDKAYSRINWQNEPSINTPLNDVNLNQMDTALNEIDNRVIALQNSAYVYIRYAPNGNPSSYDMSTTPNVYMGICVTSSNVAPTVPSAYIWNKVVGDNGAVADFRVGNVGGVSYFQYRYGATGAWINLIDISQLKGDAATIAVGAVYSGEPGTNASIVNAGTAKDAIFNFVIPRGDTGAQGPQGPKGDKGDRGEKGEQGEQGPQGIQGVKGDTGPKGDKGDTGPEGPKGDTGDMGPQGLQGPEGPEGPQGLQGDPGDAFRILGYFNTLEDLEENILYPTGGDAYGVGTTAPYKIYIYDGVSSTWVDNDTIQGPPGPQGIQGEQGLQGIQGPKGDKGDKGDTGEPGPKGDKGEPGETGPQGEQGIQGVQGIPGAKGDTGTQGAPGEQGPKGDKGDTGATGAAGPNQVTSSTATNITGLLKGNGSTVQAAVSGTDYAPPGVQYPAGMLTVTGTTTIGTAHAQKLLLFTGTAASTITLPSSGMTLLDEIEIYNASAVDLTITGALRIGSTANASKSVTLSEGQGVTLKMIAASGAGMWLIIGAFEEV